MNTISSCILGLLAIVVALFLVNQYDPSLLGLLGKREGFTGEAGVGKMADTHASQKKGVVGESSGEATKKLLSSNPHVASAGPTKEAFADLSAYEGPADFATAMPPAGCYPRDQLTPSELLPTDQDSVWAQQNPMGPGSLKGKNFLSAGALIGVNTVGQSLRNANKQLRSEPPNPQTPVSIFQQSTIAPDMNRRPLEIGG